MSPAEVEVEELQRALAEARESLEKEKRERQEIEDLLLVYERMVNASRDSITLINREFRYVAANDAYLRKRGVKKNEVVGRTVAEVWGDYAFNTFIRGAIDKALLGHHVHYQTWLNFSGSEERFVDVHFSPFHNAAGEVAYVAVTSHDITEIKHADLRNQESHRKAEVANMARSQFLAGMGHNIRTPMSSIVGLTGILMDLRPNTEQAGCLKAIKEAAESLMSYLNDAIEFFNFEEGRIEMQSIDFNVRMLIGDLPKSLRYGAYKRRAEVVPMVDASIPDMLRGDPGHLRQMLNITASTAMGFCASGPVALGVRLLRESENAIELEFDLRFTRSGDLPVELRDMFSSRFEDLHHQVRNRSGLHWEVGIAKELVCMLEGSMALEEQSGGKTRFILRVPFKKAAAPQPVRGAAAAENLRSRRVLVVDDDPLSSKLVSNYLESWGCHHEHRRSFAEALVLIQAQQRSHLGYDVVVCVDQELNGDAENFAKELRRNNGGGDTRLVMYANGGKRGDALRLQQAGYDALLTRPIPYSYLYECFCLLFAEQGRRTFLTRYAIEEFAAKTLRVLLAEDTPASQLLLSKLLVREGFKVDLAGDGQAAVEAVRHHEGYDLIIMDYHMPLLDGIESARAIRATEAKRGRRPPILLLSADHIEDVDKLLADAGIDAFLPKPFANEAFVNLLKKLSSRP